jgi:hypothetical protein
MPISPATALLFDQDYVALEWPVLKTVIPPPRPPFVMHQECSLNESQSAPISPHISSSSDCASNGIVGLCCPTFVFPFSDFFLTESPGPTMLSWPVVMAPRVIFLQQQSLMNGLLCSLLSMLVQSILSSPSDFPSSY